MRSTILSSRSLILIVMVLLVLIGRLSFPAHADPPLPLPFMPVCGDQDGSETPFLFNCPDFSPVADVQTFQVIGAESVDIQFDFVFRGASFNNELGFFLVDSLNGSIEDLQPGDPGYLAAAFSRAVVVFPSGSTAFTPDKTFSFNNGDILLFFIVQNGTLVDLISNNPDNDLSGYPLAFFSLDALNPDDFDHFVGFVNTVDNLTQFGFEDVLYGGDLDYDDVTYNIKKVLQPGQIDTDGDGLPDDWEINGVDIDGDGEVEPEVDLLLDTLVEFDGEIRPPSINHKDVYVWVDWLVREDGGYNHEPDKAALRLVKEAFDDAPLNVSNPDGQPGINLHIVLGQGLTAPATGELDELGFWDDGYDTTEFVSLKSQSLLADGSKRGMAGVFHYALYAHYLPEIPKPCPKGELLPEFSPPGGLTPHTEENQKIVPGSDFIVCHQCFVEKEASGGLHPVLQGVIFMHELGHTLGMGEGGFRPDGNGGVELENTTYKPNHLSVMNYAFMKGMVSRVPGTNGFTRSLLDYSRFELPALNEEGLYEAVGLRGGQAIENLASYRYDWRFEKYRLVKNLNEDIDWNNNGSTDQVVVKANINGDFTGIAPACVSKHSTLVATDEWKNLSYRQGSIGRIPALIEDLPTKVIVDTPDIPPDEVLGISDVWLESIVTPHTVYSGQDVEYTIELGNIGFVDETGIVITDTLPSGFSYRLGSTSGATTDDPIISGQQLVWLGPFTVPTGEVLTLNFRAEVLATGGCKIPCVNGRTPHSRVK